MDPVTSAAIVAALAQADATAAADRPAPFLLDIALQNDNVALLESVVQRWGPQALQDPRPDGLGRPPLLAAACYGAIKATEFLLTQFARQDEPQHKQLVNARHPEGGLSALFVAVWTSNAPLVRLLLDRGGADATLHYGLPDGLAEGVTIVMVAGLRAHQQRAAGPDRDGLETLRVVVEHCRARHPWLLQARDATHGRSALHYAAEQGHDGAVWLLSHEGRCDPTAATDSDAGEAQTALDISVELGFLGCAHLLRLAVGEVERCQLLRRMRALGDCIAQALASAVGTSTATVPACVSGRLRRIDTTTTTTMEMTAARLPRLDVSTNRQRWATTDGEQQHVCAAVLRYAVGEASGNGGAVLPPDLFKELEEMMGR
jgi:ankyrin repeat protein